jgi:GntR family transcriptional regulator of arabinose operon
MNRKLEAREKDRNSDENGKINTFDAMKINKNAPIPLYQQILNEIRSRIASGEWSANSQLPTEAELEEVLKVSRVTIRQAFSAAVEEGLVVRLAGKGTFVSGKELGATIVKEDGFVGYIVPHLSSSFNVQILLGVETIIRNAGFHLIFCNSEGNLSKENELIQNLQINHMAGYIIQPVYAQTKDRAISRVITAGGRVVFIDRDIPGSRADAVMSNHLEAGQKIVQHLIDQGFKEIVYLAHEPIKLPSISDRFSGYQRAMQECGLKARPPFLVGDPVEMGYLQDGHPITIDEKAAIEKIASFLSSSDRPEAIVAMNDLVAMLVLDAAEKAGLHIPSDLTVVGFDNLECADTRDITTIAQQPYEIGSEAARLLLRRIRGDREPARRILLPTQLIIRGSSANH